MNRFLSYRAAAFLGACAGVLITAWPSGLATAQATICFAPRTQLPTYASTEAPALAEAPQDWARATLLSKGAIDYLCRKFEASQLPNKVEIVRASCLLDTQDRIRVQASSASYLQLQVDAQEPTVALQLCQNLLGYLSARRTSRIEEASATTLATQQTIEQKLRVIEKSLSERLWKALTLDPVRTAQIDPVAEATLLTEFEKEAQDYHAQSRNHFFKEIQAVSDSPSFCVVEPAFIVSPVRPWMRNLALGGLGGLLFGALAKMLGRGGRAKPRKASQPWIVKSGSPIP